MTDKVEFTLDGKTVVAAKGETIWDVAKREGTRIPHLCHVDLPGYRPDGNCRACMVEIDGERVLAASCIRKPAAGMVVKTDTERAKKSREMVFELLASNMRSADAGPDNQSNFWQWASSMGIAGSEPLRQQVRRPRGRPNSTSPIPPSPSTSTPASPAAPACAPAAKCRSTTSSAWPIAAATRSRCSTCTTRWACRPA